MVTLSGCFPSETPNNTDNADPSQTDEPTEPQPYPVTVNGLTIEKTPEKVVSLSPSITEILYEMGYGDKLVGRSNYCDYPSETKNLPTLGSGTNPDIDAIIALKPDLVISATMIATMYVIRMEQAGIQTLVIPSATSLDTLKGIYKAIGLTFEGLFDGEQYGEEMFAPISKTCDNQEVINLGDFVYITENTDLATGDTLESSVLSCFGKNLAEKGTDYTFNKEYLSQFKPDIVLASDIYTLDGLRADENYSMLDAVQYGRVIFIDNTLFERPSARLTELIGKMIKDFKALSQENVSE